MKDLASVYHMKDGRVLVEIELDDLQQLFNTLDPSPFHKKDIDADAEEYIVSTVHDIAPKKDIALIVYLPHEKAQIEQPEPLAEAIHNYFEYRCQHARRELRIVLRRGWESLLVGTLFLFACVFLQSLLPLVIKHPVVLHFLQEGLIICGWVAMWGPIQVFLYEWRPIGSMLSVYRKLTRVRVDIQPAGSGQG